MSDVLVAIEAVVLGIAVTMFLYWGMNAIVLRLPQKVMTALQPWVFIGPVVVLISLFLLYPSIQTLRLSFMEEDLVGNASWVGLKNFKEIFADENFRQMLFNNILWIALVPLTVVGIALAIAQFANQVGPLREKIFKSIIFMPMAISFVSASTIWRLLYAYNAEGSTQVGVFNAIAAKLGMEAQPWISIETGKLNTILLMVIFVWLNVGYSMVLLSAAIKAVPEETIEAGRVDGANAVQIFFKVILPQIWTTVLAVFITTLIGAMKVFDIVLAMTGGNYGTNVLAQNFYLEYFIYGNTGKAMATVVVLMLAIMPVMVYQVRHYRKMGA